MAIQVLALQTSLDRLGAIESLPMDPYPADQGLAEADHVV